MKQKSCFFLTVLLVFMFSGCTTTFDLQLNGKKKTEILGHNRKVKISGGSPIGGTYSGSGVENGYFIPAKAGNGTHIITYSKPFHRASMANITVYGAPTPPKPCSRCNGIKTIPCPYCNEKKHVDCAKCNGKGIILCPECVGMILDQTTIAALNNALSVFSTCRILLGKKQQLIELSKIKYDEQSTLEPVMSFYKINNNEIVLAEGKDFNELKEYNHFFNKTDSTVPIKFMFLKKLSLLENEKIRIIEVRITYGKYELKLYYDLRDILDDRGRLTITYVYPRVILFDGKYYRLPYGLSALDVKSGTMRNNGKGWRDVEECKNWLYQEFAQKGYVKIVNDSNYIVFYSDKASSRKKNDEVWNLTKDWLNQGKDDYWKTITKKSYESLKSALQWHN